MMDSQVKTRWVCALRSDKYEQGHGRLVGEDGRGHCCLGVLAAEEDIPRELWEEETLLSCVVLERDDDHFPVKLAHDKFGIPSSVETTLANMNDGGGKQRVHTFAEIADFIEQHPEL